MCPFCEGTKIKADEPLLRCLTCGATFWRFPGSRHVRFSATRKELDGQADLAEFWTVLGTHYHGDVA